MNDRADDGEVRAQANTSSQVISGLQTDGPFEDRGERAVRRDDVADLERPAEREAGDPDGDLAGRRIDGRRRGERPGQHAGLLEVMDAVGEDAGGDDDQDRRWSP